MEDWKLKYEELKQQFENYKKEQDQFVHIVIHDLDSPLRKLSSFIDRFSAKNKDLQDEVSKNYVSRIENSIRELRSIVDALQHLSNVTVENMQFTKCDLEKIITATTEYLKDLINEKKARFHVHKLPVVDGNENQLLLLFRNLFDNSLKFSKNDLEVTISGESLEEKEKRMLNLDPQTNFVKINIADNGIGFDDMHAQNIFQPFFRLHPKSEIPGNGMGLSICKKIMENHKGLIIAEKNQNSGSRFVLILPQSTQ
jgi:signal transduction histidine kinase